MRGCTTLRVWRGADGHCDGGEKRCRDGKRRRGGWLVSAGGVYEVIMEGDTEQQQPSQRNKFSERATLALINIWIYVARVVKNTCRNSLRCALKTSLTADFQRRAVISDQVQHSPGQLNPSLIYHWQKPSQTIITVSFNTHEEDATTSLGELPACSLTR